MGVFSIDNEKHNIINIIWKTQGCNNGKLVVIRETNSQGWIGTMATPVTYISCVLDFQYSYPGENEV